MADRSNSRKERGFELLHVARAAAGTVNRIATPLYATVIVAFLAVFLTASWFLTVEADEAWMLLSTMNAFGIPSMQTKALANLTLTSGGVHLLLHGLLIWITNSIFAHRLISLLFTGLLLAMVFWALKLMDRPTSTACAGTALFAAAPGLIFQASLATAEIIATFSLLLACLYWIRRGQSSTAQALLAGILFGLSFATRVNCVVALPAILICAAFSGEGWRERVVRTVLTSGIAALVAALLIAGYFEAAQTGSGQQAQHFFMESSGVAGHKSVVQLIWAFIIGDRIMPISLIAIIVGGYVISVAEGTDVAKRISPTRLSALLLLIGLAGLGAWILKAPLPHVRYLWPAVPFLWLAGIIALTQPVIARQTGYNALAMHLFILAVCGSRLVEDSLVIANGESLTLVYQANGTAPFQMPHKSLRAAKDQDALANFVATRSADVHFYTPISASSFPITFLSRRTIDPVESMGPTGVRFIILNPADVDVWHADSAFVQWLRVSTIVSFESGEFAAYRVRDGAALPPPTRIIRLGDNDIVRPDPE